MNVNSYNSNDEEKFSDVIKALKSLPKVNAEENFEFNLMTRIENGNFELNTPEKRFYFGRFFAPAAATVAASVIVLFFIISDSGVGVENPFLLDPPIRQDYSTATTDTIELKNSQVPATSSEMREVAEEGNSQQSSGLVRVVVEPSDAVTVEEVALPFDDANSLDLDTYVSGQASQKRPSINRGSLVSGGNSVSQFDGFLIRERPSKETIESHKARLDSLKKVQKEDLE